MKSLILIVVLCTFNNIHSAPAQNGLTYYRTPSYNGYVRPYPMHQTMLLHYNNPYSARSSHASEITAFASGDRIGTGTYYQDVHEPIQGIEPPSPPPPKPVTFSDEKTSEESSGNSISIAESYPEADEPQDPELQQENEVLFEPKPTISYEPIPQNDNRPKQTPGAKPIIAQPPKTNVEIEDNESDDNFVPVDTKEQRPGQGSWPLNNFFPITFGSTSGGAIAIANSFSTGKGGTAASRATAYGSSSKQKLKKQLSH